ncbi:hypothetical protein [Polyangium jinanense]|uniref:Uncharacterized protein n=1 Tax=Polyangium jinanense TaxID=2829994 RepID=A0A9X4AT95_9BACT|nr:hypothetical protein [Polyangium jinanense]MDC3959069.1 hypothetical protein [Polyangium jinanense]MDC3984008.1 hypothetical protein [Polyangium jinanense]
MNRANVTLSEVLGAASARAAAMVPESAGYLVLSLCDALGNLPIRVDPAAVTLSAEGVVAVNRQGEVLSGAEAARGLRELLGRLLAVTAGGAPGLSAVARARAQAAERGPGVVAAEIEAALVPLNRGAAKRTLARLARETARAVEAGLVVEPAPLPAPVVVAAPVQAPVVVAAPAPAPVAAAAPAPAPVSARVAAPASVTVVDKVVSVAAIPSLPPDLLFTAPPSGPLREATPTLQDPMSIETTDATPLCSVDLALLEAPAESEKSSPAAAVLPASEPVAAQAQVPVVPAVAESTLLSAREAAVELLPPAEASPAAAPVSVKDAGTRVTHESTWPWPVGLGMRPEAPPPGSARPVAAPPSRVEEARVEEAAAVVHAVPSEVPPSAEELRSFEFEVLTPLPSPAVEKGVEALSLSGFSGIVEALEHPATEPPASVVDPVWVAPSVSVKPVAVEPAVAEEPAAAVVEEAPAEAAFVAAPAKVGPDRVDELLTRFALPEGGEEALFRATASSLKELAGLAPTPYAPEVLPAIRIPARPEGKSPEWLPQVRKEPAELAPAPLVPVSRRMGARVLLPLALLVVVLAGTGVLAWARPGIFARVPRFWKAVPSEGAERPVAATDEAE